MTRIYRDKETLRRQFPHGALEVEALPPDDARNREIAERNADLFVSQLMSGKEVKPLESVRKVSTRNETQAALPDDILVRPRVSRRLTRSQSLQTGAVVHGAKAKKATVELTPAQIAAKEKIGMILPPLQEETKPSLQDRFPTIYALGLVIVLWAFIWPAIVIWMLVLICLAPFALLIALKLPASSVRLSRTWQQFAKRRPLKAERYRKIADRIALGSDRVLDVLPNAWADRLALPDFSQPIKPDNSGTR